MKLSVPPPYCCACYGAYPDRQHVDFEAVYEGGWAKVDDRKNPISVDDLIICSDCLGSAAELIGYKEATKAIAEIAKLRDETKEQREEAIEREAYIAQLEGAVHTRTTRKQAA